jgi:molecular chaperone DnaK
MAVLGIDFGTTNTVASWLDEMGELRLVQMGEEGAITLPTVVSFMPGDTHIVGESARARMLDAPTETIYGSKRFLGRRFLSEFVGRHRSEFSYELCEGDDGLTAAFVRGHVVPLEDVAFNVLERVVELANIAADVPFDECVLSVPAHFSYRQRSLLRQAAGRLLTVKAMVNEPTAAALTYAMNATDEALLIYDLGGGTFDATLLRLKDGTCGVLATGGDAFLGGLDFDNAISRLLAERMASAHGVDILADPVVALRVRRAAEQAKIELSEKAETEVSVPVVFSDGERFLDLKETLTRGQVEQACAPLIERSIGLADAICARAGVPKDVLHGVVLVGGQTRMPAVRRRLAQVFPSVKDGDEAIDPIRSVAEGAALLGAGASRLVDVLPLPIGVMTPGIAGDTALPANARLPTERPVALPSRPAAGTPLKIMLYESIDVTSIDREMIGRVEVPPWWLDENPGDLTLHVAMSAGFDLSASVEAASGGRLPLALIGPGHSARQTAVGTGPSPTGDKVRAEPRSTVELPLHVRREGVGDFIDAKATDVSANGLFIEMPRPFPVGTLLDLEIDLGTSWTAAMVEVVRIIDAAAHSQTGKAPGCGVKFLQIDDKARAHLSAMVERQTEEIEFDVDLDDLDTPAKKPTLTVAERLRIFLEASAQQRLYDAIGIDDPLASQAEVATALAELDALVRSAMGKASPPLRERLKQIQGVLIKLNKLFLSPPARLRYDFRCGYIKAEKRLLLSQQGGPDVATLKEAWGRAFPERIDLAAGHQARAMQAAHSESWALALLEAEKALELNPFNLNLRLARKEWGVKATLAGRNKA